MNMTSEIPNLCVAIVIFLGFGESASPLCDREKVIKMFSLELLEKVLLILGEAEGVEVNWSDNLTLSDAGALVRYEMQCRHPDFSDLALDAIAWKYTFDWR